jgi:hypothetical protein
MDAVVGFLGGLTAWHWLGLGLIALAIEVVVGTFDLLWIGLAAFATALYALIAPAPLDAWPGQMTAFSVSAVGLVVLGRTVFRGVRRAPQGYPHLNDRAGAMIGALGRADGDFQDSLGRIRVGDSLWPAEQVDEPPIMSGEPAEICAADGTRMKVRRPDPGRAGV